MENWRNLMALLEEHRPRALARYKWWRVILTPHSKNGLTLTWQGANVRYEAGKDYMYEWVDVRDKG